MKERYFISERAGSDLREIWFYTLKKWPIAQADRYFNLILDEIEYISTNINCGKPMDDIQSGLRASKVNSHLIIYRVNDDIVEIIRILHERMDIDSHLD